ncbi:Protein SDA1-like protein [Bienertia sinuspersici]
MLPTNAMAILTADAIAAAGRSSDKLSLQNLQSKMKCDPESYETELQLIYQQFKSSLELFQQQANFNFNSVTGVAADSSVAKDLAEKALFLAHMTQFYPKHLSLFPKQLIHLLRITKSLQPFLRSQLTQALILLVNRKIVTIGETLELFMELQTRGDRTLKKLAYSHVIRCIQRMNKKHKDEAKNKALKNILFKMRKSEEESIAKRSLVTLCDLHRRKVWTDDSTVYEICEACFHPSSRIMIAALCFLLDYDKIQDDDDSDASSSEDEGCTQQPQVVLSREDVYKAHHKGTTASKKKKKAKLERVLRSMKKKQRLSSEKTGPNYYSPLSKLNDAQGFAERLFSKLRNCNERFEVRMMMLKVIARTVGLHQLILEDFYPFLQKYVQPHQRDITNILAATVQACHDMVPPNVVEPLFKQIVNQFVHDRSRTEAISVGLNVVREICLRMPLLMNEDLLQDLVLYKKSKEKAVSSAARSLVTLFREICPSLLVKKDRGRSADPNAKRKEYGEVNVATGVAGAELLQQAEESADDDNNEENLLTTSEEVDNDDVNDDVDSMISSGSKDDALDEDGSEAEIGDKVEDRIAFDEEGSEDEVIVADDLDDKEGSYSSTESEDSDGIGKRKRKYANFDQQLDNANSSLRTLKKLTAAKLEHSPKANGDFYSNEDFQRIKELQAKKKARCALAQHGFLKGSNSKSVAIKVPNSDRLSLRPVDPATLEANIRRKMTKEQRVALMKAGREDRAEYKSRAAVKQKKTGGLSNQQKEHKKFMPLAAKRSKMARTRIDKKRKKSISGKQFRGKKAWK